MEEILPLPEDCESCQRRGRKQDRVVSQFEFGGDCGQLKTRVEAFIEVLNERRAAPVRATVAAD